MLSLFDNPITHRNDPETSRLAADKVTKHGTRSNQAAAVLELVTNHPDCTAVELIGYGLMGEYQIRRRLTDLEHAGLIQKSGARECRIRGSKMSTWRAKNGTEEPSETSQVASPRTVCVQGATQEA